MATTQTYIAASRRPPDVNDYIDIIRRYRSWIAGPMFGGLVVATVISFFWPDTYVSRAMLSITPQSSGILATESGALMSQRLTNLENEILSRTTLEGIIREPSLDLYRNQQRVKPMEDIVAEMRKDIEVRLIGSPSMGGDGRPAASAFTIQFRYADRYKAQRVTAALASRFIEATQRAVSEGDRSTVAALDNILQGDKARLADLDGQIARFHAENQGKLPEDFQSNQQMLSNELLHVGQLTAQLQTDRESKATLEARLKTLRAQQSLAEKNAAAPPAAPAAQSVEAMSPQYLQIVNDLQNKDSQIAAARNTLGDKHPAMKELLSERASLARKKEELDRDLERRAAQPRPAESAPAAAANPQADAALLSIQGEIDQARVQIDSRDRSIAAASAELTDARRKLEAYQARIDAGPAAGQEYSRLTRDRLVAQDQYEQDQKKRSSMEQVTTARTFQIGERLEVVDSASLPEQPVEPKRGLYAVIGAAAGLMIGLMLAGAREVKNTSLKNLKDVRVYTQMTVLSSVPLLENALLVRRKRRLLWLAWSSTLVAGCLAMGASMYYYYSQMH